MLVAHDQIAGFYHQTPDLDWNAHFHKMHIGVGDGDASREEMESNLSHLIQVPHRTVGNGADTPQGLVHVSVYLAPERADNRVVDVVDHRYPGFRYLPYLLPPRRRLNPATLWRVSGYDGRGGVANHGLQFGKDTLDLGEHESFVSRANVEELNGIGYRAGRPPAQLLHFLRPQVLGHLSPP